MSHVIVSLHDVAPSKAELCRRWIEVLDARHIRATLLVVPGTWNAMSLDSSPAFIEWLHEAQDRGHEIAMHGYHHTSDPVFKTTMPRKIVGTVLARGCEEFWHLPYGEARRRLHLGLEALQGAGFFPNGFVAPGWLMSPDTLHALRATGFQYTTTHSHVINLTNNHQTMIPALSQRPQSLFSALGIGLNKAVVKASGLIHAPVRLAIHPNDAAKPALREANISLLDHLVGNGYRAMTYSEKLIEMGAPLRNDIDHNAI